MKHTVPSTILRPFRNQIASAVAAGRSLAQTAKEYDCTVTVVTELYCRAELQRIHRELENLRDELRGRRAA